MMFPKEQVPYLAIWANYGGYQGQYHLALEPATGLLDNLSYSMHRQARPKCRPAVRIRGTLRLAGSTNRRKK